MTETQSNIAQVPVTVVELAGGEVPGMESGFYYTIPTDTPDPTVPFSGPFNTKQEALEAAAEFVRECLTDFQDEPNVA